MSNEDPWAAISAAIAQPDDGLFKAFAQAVDLARPEVWEDLRLSRQSLWQFIDHAIESRDAQALVVYLAVLMRNVENYARS